MLRVETETGWWLITHQDHARLAAAFAAHWGNDQFLPPEPRASVLNGICVHDDGWAARDATPLITSHGKPSAFSEELVGKYSAFEEIDLVDYLAVRQQALREIESDDAYAALLVSMHTHNLLSARADRSTIGSDHLPILDAFLATQLAYQQQLLTRIAADPGYSSRDVDPGVILNNFRLLQATDNLSLYSCVGYRKAGTLLHSLPTAGGQASTVEVLPVAPRHFQLKPYPLDEPLLFFTVPARHVKGRTFATSDELAAALEAAPEIRLTITTSASPRARRPTPGGPLLSLSLVARTRAAATFEFGASCRSYG